MQLKRNKQNHLMWVGLLTLIIVSATFYSFYKGREIAERYAPLVDAAMEIK